MAELTCPSCGHELPPEFRFCPNCGFEIPKSVKCLNCGYENEANSKFCQECAQPLLDKAPATRPTKRAPVPTLSAEPEPPPQHGVTIEFPFTTSQTFEFALKAASAFPSFRRFGEAKKAIYRVNLSSEDLANVSDLLEHVKTWRRRTVYVDGQKVPWDSVFAYSWCYERKKGSFKPEFYCFGYENDYEFNVWGCIQAHLPFSDNAEWCTWGTWLDTKGSWEFDKQRIIHELQKRLFSFRFCPALQPRLIEDVVRALPSPVKPSKDPNWKFLERWGDDSGPGLSVTVERYGFKETVVMRGVAPIGQGALREMAKRVGNRIPTRT